MLLPSAMTNLDGITVLRRDGYDAGGDPSFSTVHESLRAFHQEKDELVRNEEGAVRVKKGLFVFPAHDHRGNMIEIQEGDNLRYNDYKGAQRTREVKRVHPIFVLSRLSQLEVEVD